MRKNYNWRCKVCDVDNLFSAETCRECRSPKVMRPIEVDAAIAERHGHALPPEDKRELERLEKVDNLSPGERALYWAFMIPGAIVLALIKFGFWAILSAFGFMGFLALAVIGVISWIVASALQTRPDSR